MNSNMKIRKILSIEIHFLSSSVKRLGEGWRWLESIG